MEKTKEEEEKEMILAEMNAELRERGFKKIAELNQTPFYRKALYTREKIDVVLKIYDKREIYKNPVLKDTFSREQTACKKVRSAWTHLMASLDFFYLKNFAVFVYESYPMGNLEEKIESVENFDLKEIVILFKDLLQGLEELKLVGLV